MLAAIGPCPRFIRSSPSTRSPIPTSKISRPPSRVSTSMHDVLPPKWLVPDPGVAMEPRVPQNRTCIAPSYLHGPACLAQLDAAQVAAKLVHQAVYLGRVLTHGGLLRRVPELRDR